MKILIYGASETGCMLATEFFEDHDITVIDSEENRLEDFNKLDISFVYGNGSNINVLKTALIDESDIFIACTESDEANIVSCLVAKQISDATCICFVSKKEYIDSVSLMKNKTNLTEQLIDYVIWPEELLTQQIFKLITTPLAISVENFAMNKACLLEYRIKEKSTLLGKKIMECDFPEDILVVGISSNSKLSIPKGDTIFHLNDKVIFMGKPQSLEESAKKYIGVHSKINSVGIIGGGNMGVMLAEKLENTGIKVKIIEKDYDRCVELSETLKKALVICGNGTDIELLRTEQIENCDAVICVTNNDEKNLLCSLLSKQLGVAKVITRVSKTANINLFEKVGIDVAVSPKDAAIKDIKNTIIENDLGILASVEQGQGEIIEVQIPSKFNEYKVMDLSIPAKAVIAIIQRDNEIIIPKGYTKIFIDDTLIIFTKEENSTKIKEYFKE